jgi:hypothetical protein
MAAQGEFDAGTAMLAEGMGAFIARGDPGSYDLFRYTAAAAFLQAGRADEGLALVREAIAKPEASLLFEAEMHRLEGELLLLAPRRMKRKDPFVRQSRLRKGRRPNRGSCALPSVSPVC